MLIKSVNKKAKFVAVNKLTHKMNLPFSVTKKKLTFSLHYKPILRLLRLVLICRRTICDIAAGTAREVTVPTYENIRRRQRQPSQAFTADVPAKLNSSQLRRLAGVKACDGCCSRRRMFSYRNSIPGSSGGYVADSSAAYENQRLQKLAFVNKDYY